MVVAPSNVYNKVVIDSLKSGSGSIPKGKSNKRRESKSNQLVKIIKSKV